MLALVDGEHYPPVVRAALRAAPASGRTWSRRCCWAARRSWPAIPDYGVPLERVGDAAAGDALVAAAERHGATGVLDLSDEPVLDEERADRAGLPGAGRRPRVRGRRLRAAPARAGADRARRRWPSIGTGKRVGKTAVSGHVARVLHERGHATWWWWRWAAAARPSRRWSIAAERPVGVAELLERSRAGQHAASDFLEDAALARVTTVGARRCGGGLAGAPYMSNVAEAARLAAARRRS